MPISIYRNLPSTITQILNWLYWRISPQMKWSMPKGCLPLKVFSFLTHSIVIIIILKQFSEKNQAQCSRLVLWCVESSGSLFLRLQHVLVAKIPLCLRLGVALKSTDCEFDLKWVNKGVKFDIARIRCTFARKSSCIGKYFCIHQNINFPNLGLLENLFPLVTHHDITPGVVILNRFCYSGKQGFWK